VDNFDYMWIASITTGSAIERTPQGTYAIWMVRNWDAVGAVLEVSIAERAPTKWEWRVCDRYGTIMGGFESTRPAAKYRGDRALFLLLASGWNRSSRGHRGASPAES
jgi:hypothetical protein